MLVVQRRLRGLGDANSLALLQAAGGGSQNLVQLAAAAGLHLSQQVPPAEAADAAATQSTQFTLTSGQDRACQCAVQQISQMVSTPAGGQAAAYAQCMQNYEAFVQTANSMGVTDLVCPEDQVWYKKPSTWIIGGVALIAGVVAVKVVL
jgi:hypothetical protein